MACLHAPTRMTSCTTQALRAACRRGWNASAAAGRRVRSASNGDGPAWSPPFRLSTGIQTSLPALSTWFGHAVMLEYTHTFHIILCRQHVHRDIDKQEYAAVVATSQRAS